MKSIKDCGGFVNYKEVNWEIEKVWYKLKKMGKIWWWGVLWI